MYRTSNQIRIFSAALAAVFGLGLVATAGGALNEDRPLALQLVRLEPVVIKPAHSPSIAAACDQTPKAAL